MEAPEAVECEDEPEGATYMPAVDHPSSSIPRRTPRLEEPLPVPFPLPKNYPALVDAGLQAKSLNGKAAVKFITEIAHAIFRFKNYPTREEKEHVARQCVKAYPFLEATCGTGHVSCRHLILYMYISCMCVLIICYYTWSCKQIVLF